MSSSLEAIAAETIFCRALIAAAGEARIGVRALGSRLLARAVAGKSPV